MENKPNNPFAFSSTANKNEDTEYEQGMTLRDYFANSAMQAMITAMYTRNELAEPDKLFERMELISTNSYWYADQMLKQREL